MSLRIRVVSSEPLLFARTIKGVRGSFSDEPHRWPFWVTGHAHVKDFKPHSAKVPFLMRSPICCSAQMSRLMTKPTMWLCTQRRQISLGICPVWSESLLCAQRVDKDPSFLHADNEDSDQTGRMSRLIWVFAGHTVILLVLLWGSSDVPDCHFYWLAACCYKWTTDNDVIF